VVVMRLGKNVATFNVKESTSGQVVAAITGAEYGNTNGTHLQTNAAAGGSTNE
jgi:D-xylose transport system ATP-binding protein